MFKPMCICMMLAALPMTAAAQSFEDQILAQLTEQGFEDFEVSRTFLGRIRVISTNETLTRELVFNPNTGEILRDYWKPIDDAETTQSVRIANPTSDDNTDAAATPPPRPRTEDRPPQPRTPRP